MRSKPSTDLSPTNPTNPAPPASATFTRGLLIRSTIGGVLMGLANLVPGVSGGTMLLAAGVYRDFIDAVASISRFKIQFRPIVVLATISGTAALAILLGAGLLKDLVVHQRWLMYALFVGLTLGGIPLVWRPVRRKGITFWAGSAAGLTVMILLFLTQRGGAGVSSSESTFLPLAVAGTAGASAMILPGLSGGYLLLLLGQYVPILSGLDRLKEALVDRDLDAIMMPILDTVLPVGLGVVIGVVLISNLVQWFFRRYETTTYGFLLGLLLGVTIGLWPFQKGVDPEIGDTIKGQMVTADSIDSIEPEDYLLQYFNPSGTQAGLALLMLGIGVGTTAGISRFGRSK